MNYLLLHRLEENAKKVSLARMLHQKGEMPLTKAKEIVDGLLIGKHYWMVHRTKNKLDILKEEATTLGLECVLIDQKTLGTIISREQLLSNSPVSKKKSARQSGGSYELIEAN